VLLSVGYSEVFLRLLIEGLEGSIEWGAEVVGIRRVCVMDAELGLPAM
jgi:hypothetical protein